VAILRCSRAPAARKPRLFVLAAALTAAALVFPVTQAASAHASPTAAAARSASDANPLEGLTYDAASIRDFLDTISGPVILVGHSYGGAVITNAATGDASVKALVYVDAFIPAQGQTVGQLVSAVPGTCTGEANLDLVPYPDAPAGAVDAYIKQSVFPSCMANGIPAAEQLAMAAAAHAHVTEVDAPHLSMITDPGVVTQVILEAVHATT
jgi:pimeloyl-ACP methyl ester carboxylesterase